MGDFYGSLPLPATAPATGAALTDPLLDTLLGFIAGAMQDQLGTAWAARSGGAPIVREKFNYNPYEHGIDGKAFPALYAWRSRVDPLRRAASDWYLRDSQLSFLWVPEQAPSEKSKLREGILHGIDAAVSDAFEFKARTPSYVRAGDSDPQAATLGSYLWTFAKVFSLKMGTTLWAQLTVATKNEKVSPFVRGVQFTLDVVERNQRDLAQHYAVSDGIEGVDTNLSPPNPAVNSLALVSNSDPASRLLILNAEFNFEPFSDA